MQKHGTTKFLPREEEGGLDNQGFAKWGLDFNKISKSPRGSFVTQAGWIPSTLRLIGGVS
jgi:hypothetical protein